MSGCRRARCGRARSSPPGRRTVHRAGPMRGTAHERDEHVGRPDHERDIDRSADVLSWNAFGGNPWISAHSAVTAIDAQYLAGAPSVT